MGRIGAWGFAWSLAKDRPVGGGGFDTFQESAYQRWAPEARAFDPHSIWFQVLAEHGFVGLGLFILFWLLTWRIGSQIIGMTRDRSEFTWARDLAGMVQAALIGFWVGGSFLGLAYWDYPYLLAIVLPLTKVVLERRIREENIEATSETVRGGAALHPQA
jgi:putative inorganic carbon (HCO3(-)) transporter